MALDDQAQEEFEQLPDSAKAVKTEAPSDISDKVTDDKPASLGKIVWDVIKYTPVLGGMFAASSFLGLGAVPVLSTAITATGFAIGNHFENKRSGKKTSWKDVKRETIAGNIFGLVDYTIFSIPEFLMGLAPGYFGQRTFTSMLVNTLLVNPLVLPPAVAAYQALMYIRDEVGYTKFALGFLNGKIFEYMKGIYNRWKTDLVGDSLKLLPMFPLHFFQLNYLPNTPLRMAQSAFVNNPLLRYVLGGGKKQKKAEPSPTNTKQPAYQT